MPQEDATPTGPGFIFTFFYYSVLSTAIATFTIARVSPLTLESGVPQQVGLLVGLLAGGVGGYVNRTSSFFISASAARQQQLHTILVEMNYLPVEQDGATDLAQSSPLSTVNYRKTGWRSLLAGPIMLTREKKQITVTARSAQLKRIQAQVMDESAAG